MCLRCCSEGKRLLLLLLLIKPPMLMSDSQQNHILMEPKLALKLALNKKLEAGSRQAHFSDWETGSVLEKQPRIDVLEPLKRLPFALSELPWKNCLLSAYVSATSSSTCSFKKSFPQTKKLWRDWSEGGDERRI